MLLLFPLKRREVHGIIFFYASSSLPVPSLPPLSLIPDILLDSFVITMVSYTISMSMALIFAQKFSYEVDSNQELMAQVILVLIVSNFEKVSSAFIISFELLNFEFFHGLVLFHFKSKLFILITIQLFEYISLITFHFD